MTNPKIVTEPVKRFKTTDGKLYTSVVLAMQAQATLDHTKGVEELEGEQYKTTDGRTWAELAPAEAHQAMLDFEPVLKRYIDANASTFAVQGAETRFRSLTAPFLGWLSANGVDISPALPEEAEAAEAA